MLTVSADTSSTSHCSTNNFLGALSILSIWIHLHTILPAMSDVTPSMFPIKPEWSAICSTHRQPVEWSVVKANLKGNQGRWYAKCKIRNEDGMPCSYFRWGSPRTSPTQLPQISPVPLPSLSSQARHCAVPGCKFPRIAADCENICCHTHCITFGGCKLKNHFVLALSPPDAWSLTQSLSPTPVLSAAPSPLPSASPSPLPSPLLSPASALPDTVLPPSHIRSSSRQASRQPARQSRGRHASKGKGRAIEPSTEVDILADPHHQSQLPPIFMERYAEQERTLQQTQAKAASDRDFQMQVANTVNAYGWCKDGEDAQLCEFQNGFVYPKFPVTTDILAALGLPFGIDGKHLVQYFNPSCCRWVQIFQGHVLTLDARSVYLCNVGVTVTPDFDSVFTHSSDAAAPPHLRKNLPRERASVHLAINQDIIADASLPSSPAPLPLPLPPAPSPSPPVPSPSPPPTVLRTRHRKVVCTSDLLDLSIDLDESDEHDGDRTITPSSSGLSPEHPIDVDAFIATRRWPSDFYTCEVSACFDACRKAREAGKSFKSTFLAFYGPKVKFNPSTFTEHYQRWFDAPVSMWARFVSCGMMQEGLYSMFMKESPARHAQVKAVKKRLKAN
ncbi:hypothetical protein DFJ58DRAFT_732587 [Suillus subalutaceus]|uniref:uncharacterized protein n=1 Tax=Suillus subalutaceus TaxID=48586 RepID=UPI001B8722D7|nr:uncharacterized protein DFJ58DRAFT_732587 [Suillus subalutaceus]KAG1841135.1 hypothetical protein DFJ58DRAFT_732587 [Suillus subalutaceus]